MDERRDLDEFFLLLQDLLNARDTNTQLGLTFEFLLKWISAKLLAKMVGEQDNPATALMAINVNSNFSFLVEVRLVNAELSTIICTVVIDFLLHSVMTYRIIEEYRTFHDLGITMLLIAELIEGITLLI